MISKKKGIPVIKLFWTGGFDSTFRIIQLSRLEVIVHPYYIADYRHRNSIDNELETIKTITQDIINDPDTKFLLEPITIIDAESIEPDNEITIAHKRLIDEIALGSQYKWLAAFAKSHPGIELTIEKGRLQKYFEKVVVFSLHNNGGVSYKVIDKSKSCNDVVIVFGDFHFPYPICELTKLEIVEEYRKMGYGDTMNKTWFCHNPVKNEPCGVCTPCKQVIAKGMSFRIKPSGMKRYETDLKYGEKLWFRLFKKIRWRIYGY